MEKAIFFHAGCPVCASAEQGLLGAIDPKKYDVEVVHLGRDNSRLAGARDAGVKSVPALVPGDAVFHINFGASLADLR